MEMNIFIPQSTRAMIELKEIADVKRQLITPRLSIPIIGIIQDGIVGCYNISSPSVRVDWHDAMNIVSYTSVEDFTGMKKKDMTGSELFSMIIPSRINTSRGITVEEGKLTSGRLKGSYLKSGAKNSLIHLVWDEYGMEKTKSFIDDIQRLINNFNLGYGVTCGLGDIEVSDETNEKMEKMFESEKLEVAHMVTEMENNPELMDVESFETVLYQKIDTIREKAQKLVMANLSEENNFLRLVASGAKGKPTNIGLMAGCVGLQSVETALLKKRVNGRVLPYFARHDDTALARGFIENSFVKGVNLSEFVFHNMDAREGLIDTAIKSVTGDTEIIIVDDGEVKKVAIGDWIDRQMSDRPAEIERHEKYDQELLDVLRPVSIPTTDAAGRVHWGAVTKITRHDATEKMYRVTTESGRRVTVTDSESLLHYNLFESKVERIAPHRLTVAHYLPVTQRLGRPTTAADSSVSILHEAMQEEVLEEFAEMSDDLTLQAFYRSRLGEQCRINGSVTSTTEFQTFGDLFLDPVASVEEVDPSQYPKVYDLTVPETLNFAIANGLQVRDTAESGYVQRKLIKAQEDACVKYDGTVRNATNTVLQFTYGDSGIDTTRQVSHILEMIEMDNEAMEKRYLFTDSELSRAGWSKEENRKYYAQIIEIRSELRKIQYLRGYNYAVVNKDFMLPANLNRIINNTKTRKLPKSTPLKAKYVVDQLESVLDYSKTQLTTLSEKDLKSKTIKLEDEVRAKSLIRFALHEFFAPKRCLTEYRITKEQFDLMMEELVESFNRAVVEPGEMVGIVAAQSIGEPTTQLTLNSIDWTEEIVVSEKGVSKIVKIGEFIDAKMEEMRETVEFVGEATEMNDTYYLPLDEETAVYAPSVTPLGEIEWRRVTALTKHLPVNPDGTHTLVKVTTRGGKSVMATKAKSFLTRQNNAITPTRGDEIRVGDYLPVAEKLPQLDGLKSISLEKVFPKTEYVWGSEILKAAEVKKRENAKGSRNWFKGFNGVEYTAPYSRYDSLKEVIDKIGTNPERDYKEGCIYPKSGRQGPGNLPSELELDWDAGFFFGAYLADGCATKTYIAIAKNDAGYRAQIKKFADRYDIGTHVQDQTKSYVSKTGHKIEGRSCDIRLHSTMFAKLMTTLCGQGSVNKFVPAFALDANIEFVKGLLSGYFSGDGSVDEWGSINACSVTHELLERLSLLLIRIGVAGKIAKPSHVKKTTVTKNAKQMYTLRIGAGYRHRFAKSVRLLIDHKQERLNRWIDTPETNFGTHDMVPSIELSSGTYNFSRQRLHMLLQPDAAVTGKNGTEFIRCRNSLTKSDRRVIKQTLMTDVYWDQITSIEEVEPTKKYVYDLTVEGTKTFMMKSALLGMDTFHLAGVASVGASNLGVGRIKELLSFTKNPKEPMTVIYVDREHRENLAMVNKIAYHIKYTTIGDLAVKLDIYYDPDPFKKGGFTEKDKAHNVFYSYNPGKNSCAADLASLPWLIRIKLDREKMINKEVTLLDIKSRFCSQWEKRFAELKGVRKEERDLLAKVTQCAITSNHDNSPEPILHLRLDLTDFNMSTLINFQEVIINRFKLKGIEEITGIQISNNERLVEFNDDNGKVEINQQHVVYTEGVNMTEIRYINGIDLSRTVTNDVVQIYHHFGIEAARTVLLKELKMVFGHAGSEINYQHLTVLIDTMTNNGTLISVDRHGLNRLDTDPLARCSFEKTIDQLLTAAVFAEKSRMESVSSRIMAGMVIKGGTGICDLVLDAETLEQSEYVENLDQKYQQTFRELGSDAMMDDLLKKDEIGGFMPM